MYNQVTLIGRITHDIELRQTQNGKTVTTLGLAVNRRFGDETDYLNVVVWDKLAENVCKYQKKGNLILVNGRIQCRDWSDDNGEAHRAVEIVAEDVVFFPNGGRTDNAQTEAKLGK